MPRPVDVDPSPERLAVLAHELRSPLAVIAMAIASLRTRGLAQPHQTGPLDVIERQTGVALELVARLTADIDAGTNPVHPSPQWLDLAAVTFELMADLRPSLGADRRITFGAPTPVHVVADRLAICEIATNLLTNAARHTPSCSPIDVTVTLEDGVARLTVLDQGAGITHGDRDRIFDRDVTVGPTSDGHGLGLFIARQLAHANGGELTVDDNPTGGARFTLELPRGRLPVDGVETARSTSVRSRPAGTQVEYRARTRPP